MTRSFDHLLVTTLNPLRRVFLASRTAVFNLWQPIQKRPDNVWLQFLL